MAELTSDCAASESKGVRIGQQQQKKGEEKKKLRHTGNVVSDIANAIAKVAQPEGQRPVAEEAFFQQFGVFGRRLFWHRLCCSQLLWLLWLLYGLLRRRWLLFRLLLLRGRFGRLQNLCDFVWLLKDDNHSLFLDQAQG